jgi:integrase
VWLPNHRMEVSTRQGYTLTIEKHLLPGFGATRMNEILPSQVRDFVRRLTEAGTSATTLQRCKTVLSSIFTTALNDQVIFLHPCAGVTTPPVVAQPLAIVTPAEFAAILAALPDDQSRLLAEVAIESGLRWGELAELRTGDLDAATGMLTVARTVVELRPKYHPDGGRFLVKRYPKDREFRRVKLSARLTARIAAHAAQRRLGPLDLLFTAPCQPPRAPAAQVPRGPDLSGATTPNRAGRCYRHGTLTGYSMGGCRCRHRRGAYAAYRAARRAAGKDQPRPGRTLDTDGHMPRTGSVSESGSQPSGRSASGGGSGYRTCGTRTPPGCWAGEQTCRSCGNGSATPGCAPPNATCTPCRMPATPPWPPTGAPAATVATPGPRDPRHGQMTVKRSLWRRRLHQSKPLSCTYVVGDTGIEPVASTVSKGYP